MIRVSPLQAELLSYLTGRGPVGKWFTAPLDEIREDLDLRGDQLSHRLRSMERKGLVERMLRGDVFRVVRRLEDPEIEIVEPPNPNGPPEPFRKARGLIRYCGYDPHEVWEHA